MGVGKSSVGVQIEMGIGWALAWSGGRQKIIFCIGSQWGIQDFDTGGGGPPKKNLAIATLGMI